MKINRIHTILYVHDQQASTSFYQQLLRQEPALYVQGMTEFCLSDCCILGLMPNEGIAKILTDHMPHPNLGSGIPRCELYLYVNDVLATFHHALQLGAKLISPVSDRNWGDTACYFADPDGHIIAFAQKTVG